MSLPSSLSSFPFFIFSQKQTYGMNIVSHLLDDIKITIFTLCLFQVKRSQNKIVRIFSLFFLLGVTCVRVYIWHFIFRWKFSKIKSIWMPMSLYIFTMQCNAMHVLCVSTNMIFDSSWIPNNMQAHAFKRTNAVEEINSKMSILQSAFALSFTIVWPSHVFSFGYLYANTK